VGFLFQEGQFYAAITTKREQPRSRRYTITIRTHMNCRKNLGRNGKSVTASVKAEMAAGDRNGTVSANNLMYHFIY
jgi:hypothetical protein